MRTLPLPALVLAFGVLSVTLPQAAAWAQQQTQTPAPPTTPSPTPPRSCHPPPPAPTS
ncbi:hypothetical protein KPL78_09680 [Roseomonas sp. HJA6]|uniref:Uncharacterized protein n=1 Tax=Roseomonas alba TaxID=2846776 RepID=A0ABS7A760_9PROT|nr:hypothetical protein [Neoroseomonas alba]